MIDGGYGLFDGSLNPSAGSLITITRASTNVLDLLVGRDIGAGIAYDQELHVDVMAAFDNGATPTLQIQVQSAPDNGSGAPGSYTTLLETDVIPGSALIVGARIARYPWPVIQRNYPAGDTSPPRFLRLNYVVASGPFTVGSVMAYLNVDREERLIYPENYKTA